MSYTRGNVRTWSRAGTAMRLLMAIAGVAALLVCGTGCSQNPCSSGDPNGPDTTVQYEVLLVPGEYPTIEGALTAAADGDTIRIACGTYFEHGLELKAGVRIEGEDREEPCVVIDAQQEGRIFRVPGDCGPETELMGLELTNGYAAEGGAMYLDHESAPTLTNMRFVDNTVSDPNGEGGAIRCIASSPTLTNVVFSNNSAAYGGAISCYLESRPVFVDCEFTGNTATGLAHGGALNSYEASVQARRCTFSDNSGTDGGAVDCRVNDGDERAVFEECVFLRNTGFHGGGLFGRNVDLIACEFVENTGYYGGGIEGYFVVAENCVFRGNTAGHGGAFAMMNLAAGERRVESTLSGCTLYGNSGEHAGGGVYVYRLHVNLINTIVAGSTSGAAVDVNGFQTSGALTCCDLYGNAGGDWVEGVEGQLGIDGNICEDPLFCDPEVDLSIGAASPCAPENSGGCGLIGAVGVGCD